MCKKSFLVKFLTLLSLTIGPNLCFGGEPDEEGNVPPPVSTNLIGPLPKALIAREIFSYGTLADVMRFSEVNKQWQSCANDASLWRSLGQVFAEDYSPDAWTDEASKKTVMAHELRKKINTFNTPEEIKAFTRSGLVPLTLLRAPRVRFADILDDLVIRESWYIDDSLKERLDSWAERGIEAAITRKVVGLRDGVNGYEKNWEAASQAYRASTIAPGNTEVINRAIIGLCGGHYGYKDDPAAARELNDALALQGNEEAIERKITGFYNGECGYEKDPAAARELNETLITQGNQGALSRKVNGLSFGRYGYKKDLAAARELNETLITQGNGDAIDRKVIGFHNGYYGYEEDPVAARKLDEILIAQGNQGAINRKDRGLFLGVYGYEKDPDALKDFTALLIAQGNEAVITQRFKCTENRSFEPTSIPLFVESVLQNGKPNRLVHALKGLGMKYGLFGFEMNKEDANAYIEKRKIAY